MRRLTRFFQSRVLVAATASLLTAVALSGVALATAGSGNAYAGCLGSGGRIKNVAVGTDPRRACDAPQVEIVWNQSGPQGPSGPPGSGYQGAAGLAGPKGDDGADGAPGVPGAQGAQGAAGPAGPKGDDGADGAPGVSGAQGVPGAQGAQGVPGSPGAQGAQGVPGSPGAQGVPGLSGLVVASGSITGSGTSLYLKVDCPTGKFLIGGGASTSGSDQHLVSSMPNGNGWSAQALGTSVTYLSVQAICATVAS